MYVDQTKIAMLDVRVVSNALVFGDGNWFESFEYLGTGEYRIKLNKDVDFNNVNIRCVLFGAPVVSD